MRIPLRAVLIALLVCAATASLVRWRHPHFRGTDGQMTLRFAYQNRIGSALPILAVELGLFEQQGLHMRVSRFNSGPACAEALFTGAADIGTMGDTTTVIALARQAPLRIIASHARGEARHRVIVAADAPYQTLHDLSGQRIAVKKGTSTYGAYLRFLDTQGLARDGIKVVDLEPHLMPDALAAGSIQAFAASEPTPSLGELRGGRQLLTFAGQGNHFPLMILATEQVLQQRPEALQRFLAALREAESFLAENPESAVAIVARATGLPIETADRVMRLHEFRLDLTPETLHSLNETARFLRDQGLIANLPDLQTAAYPPSLP